MMNKALTEDEIRQMLEEMSDVADEEENVENEGNTDNIEGLHAPLRFPDIPTLENRDYPADSVEDDEPEVARNFTGTNKKEIRWMRSREPFILNPDNDFPGEYNSPVPSMPSNPYEYFAKYIGDSFFCRGSLLHQPLCWEDQGEP